MLNQRKYKLIFGAIILLVVIMTLLLWPLRSWTRNTFAMNIVGALHELSTIKMYDKDFIFINRVLKDKGFQLIDKATLPYDDQDGLNTYKPLQGCRVDGYEGVHETIICQKVGEYKPKSPKNSLHISHPLQTDK